MSIFDTIKYPLSYPPRKEELTNLPEPMFRLFVELVIKEFHFAPLLKGQDIYEYCNPKVIIAWQAGCEPEANYRNRLGDQTTRRMIYFRIIDEARKAIAELP